MLFNYSIHNESIFDLIALRQYLDTLIKLIMNLLCKKN